MQDSGEEVNMYHCGQKETKHAERDMQRMHEHKDSLAFDNMGVLEARL